MSARASWLACLLIVASASLPLGSSSAQERPARTEDVAAMLSGFEATPSLDEWRAIGPSAIPLLREIAADRARPGFVRMRAVAALAAYPTTEVRTDLRRFLRDAEPLMVREAALAMARAFGASSLEDLAPLLSHHDTAVREAVVSALGRMGTADARTRLQRRLVVERDAALRQRIQQQLSGGVGSNPG